MQNEVQAAAARVAGLYAHGRVPTPEAEMVARAQLATMKLDREIRRSVAGDVYLDDAQVGHLVGLLLIEASHVDGDTCIALERIVRSAVAGAK